MKSILLLLALFAGASCFCQERTLLPNNIGNEDALPANVNLKNDTSVVILKTVEMVTGNPQFVLRKATAIYSQRKVFYWSYPAVRCFSCAATAEYRLPVEDSRIEKSLLKVIVSGRVFNLAKYHELIPLEQIIVN